MKKLSIYCACLLAAPLVAQAQGTGPKLADRTVTVQNIKVENTNHSMVVGLDLNMDSVQHAIGVHTYYYKQLRGAADAADHRQRTQVGHLLPAERT